jgi:hypothetical protein
MATPSLGYTRSVELGLVQAVSVSAIGRLREGGRIKPFAPRAAARSDASGA